MKKDWMIKESELDDIQIRVLMSTLNKSCVVSGCAGSGKSVLALIKAQRVQKMFGNNYHVILYTRALCDYMNAGRVELGLRNDFCTHWEWVYKKGSPHADYIIVDEIQDFTEEEIRQFIASANKNFYFFGDTAQSIYKAWKPTMRVEDIRLITSKHFSSFPLYNNYRLPLPVAKVAWYVNDEEEDELEEEVYQSPETAMPRFIWYASKDEQIAAIDRIIRTNQMTDVAIVLPDNDAVKNVYGKLSRMGNYEVRYKGRGQDAQLQDSLDFDSSNPKIMTYYSVKGLQFETVFLPFVEDFTEGSNQKALYVAMTRTYRNLYVLYSDGLPEVFENINPDLYKTTEDDADEVEDF